ncbi:MAG: NAD-dependent epimerase/dehydratase family protein [Mycobacteriaceae bacterium]
MKMLVLGGTVFLSHAVASVALRRGHTVVCAHRGRSGLAPAGAKDLFLDRDDAPADGSEALAGRRFDAVVDVATREPRWVREALTVLAAGAKHWTFVSSVSVYADTATPGQDASAERVAVLDAHTPDEQKYVRAKRSSEDAVLETMGDRAFIVRPGLVAGPGDPSDRYGYWPARFTRGGPVAVPDTLAAPTQVIDVGDVAAWIVTAAEHRLHGCFDAVAPAQPLGEVLARSGGAGAELVPVSQHALLAAGVSPWSGPRSLPLWAPQPEMAGFGARDVSASLAAGLALRPLTETAQRALAHEKTLGLGRQRKSGLTPEDETRILKGA